MKKMLVVVVVLSLAVLSVGVMSPDAARAAGVRGKHASEGVTCVDCHKVDKPVSAASVAACLECHGPYEKVAQLTRKLHANPHDSHMGQMDCLKCHGIHKPSQIPCLECHVDFEFKEK